MDQFAKSDSHILEISRIQEIQTEQRKVHNIGTHTRIAASPPCPPFSCQTDTLQPKVHKPILCPKSCIAYVTFFKEPCIKNPLILDFLIISDPLPGATFEDIPQQQILPVKNVNVICLPRRPCSQRHQLGSPAFFSSLGNVPSVIR